MFLNLIQKYVAITAFFIIFSAIISVPTVLVPEFGFIAAIVILTVIAVPTLAILHAIDVFVDKLANKSSLT